MRRLNVDLLKQVLHEGTFVSGIGFLNGVVPRPNLDNALLLDVWYFDAHGELDPEERAELINLEKYLNIVLELCELGRYYDAVAVIDAEDFPWKPTSHRLPFFYDLIESFAGWTFFEDEIRSRPTTPEPEDTASASFTALIF